MTNPTSRQLSLFGSSIPPRMGSPRAPAPKVVHFFAVLPPDEIRAELTRLRLDMAAQERFHGKAVAPERLHLSIARLYDCEPADLPKSMKHLEALANEIAVRVTMPSFEVCFDRLQTFRLKKDKQTWQYQYLLVLSSAPTAGLVRFRDLFRRSFAKRGLGVTKAFNPHISLIYGNRPIAPRNVTPRQWVVGDFALVQSFHGQGKHVILKRWPLTG